MSICPKIYTEKHIEILNDLYVNKKMSTVDIELHSEKEFGFFVSRGTIYKEIIRRGIKIRDKSESISIATATLDSNISFIDEKLIQWIDGFLLGDGSINFNHNEKFMSSRFCFGSVQKEWTDYAMSGLFNYLPKESYSNGKTDEKCPNLMWASRTLTHPDIRNQAKRWYPSENNYKKKVPIDVRVTPISVLLWYLGDGSFHYSDKGNISQLRLATCSFYTEDLESILIPKLKECNIDSFVDYAKNDIHIRASSTKDFFNLIGWKSPVSCYDYKFNIPDWLGMIRLSDIVKSDKEKWRAQYYYKSGKIEATKSPGGKMLLFTEEQANKLRELL